MILRSALFLCLVALLQGCASVVSTPFQSAQELVKDPTKGYVWVFWDAPSIAMRIHPVKISVDDVEVGSVYANGYSLLALSPGQRVITGKMGNEGFISRFVIDPRSERSLEFKFSTGVNLKESLASSAGSVAAGMNATTLSFNTKAIVTVNNTLSEAGKKSSREFVYVEK